MVVGGVMRKVAPDFLRSWVYYFKVHGSLNFLSEMAVVTQKRAQVEVPRREALLSSVHLFPSRGRSEERRVGKESATEATPKSTRKVPKRETGERVRGGYGTPRRD